MITTEEARNIITGQAKAGNSERQYLTKSLGKILREDLSAPIDLPQFDQSAMDGFAIRFTDLANFKEFTIVGESSAGTPFKQNVQAGETVRIFTGAAVPEWADHIITVEMATVNGDRCVFNDPNGMYGQHIRKRGSQIASGEIAVRAGTKINPATIGFLYSFGFTEVAVNRELAISILVTGNELRKPEESIAHGEIYESNSVMLAAACQSIHETNVRTVHCRDNENELTETVRQLLETSDVVIVTGGISAGEYDYTAKAFANCGVTKHFHKIAQKPGKPMFYGTVSKSHVFGLPGNPAAALTCFYEYVLPCINKLNGAQQLQLPACKLSLDNSWKKKPGLANYLKGSLTDTGVRLLPGQESFILKSFSEADALVYIPQDADESKSGTSVEVHFLPFG